MRVYTTSFCNQPHDLKTGKPIEHECYVIPPNILRAEREKGYTEEVMNMWYNWSHTKRIIHKGIKREQ